RNAGPDGAAARPRRSREARKRKRQPKLPPVPPTPFALGRLSGRAPSGSSQKSHPAQLFNAGSAYFAPDKNPSQNASVPRIHRLPGADPNPSLSDMARL